MWHACSEHCWRPLFDLNLRDTDLVFFDINFLKNFNQKMAKLLEFTLRKQKNSKNSPDFFVKK
jgi:hypothetical protein